VERLRTSGIGYGNAIYFRLWDGRTIVLGHLSRFVPRLERLAIAEQDRLGSYEIDLVLPDPPRFEAGEVLGFTGQSGAGPPHLHAEIRTDPEAAIAANPLRQGWRMTDTEAPTLDRLLLVPAAPESRVDGGIDTVVVDLRGGTPPSISVVGPVRMWAECSDRAVPGGNRLAPYELSWWVDGVPGATVRFDRFDWHWAREAEVTFLAARARSAKERWIRLQPIAGVRRDLVRPEGDGDLLATLPPGEHRLRLRASDAEGNAIERTVGLVVEAAGAGRTILREEPPGLVSRGTWLLWSVEGEGPLVLEGRTPGGEITEEAARFDPAPAAPRWIGILGSPVPPEAGEWRLRAKGPGGEGESARAIWLGPEQPEGGAPPRETTVTDDRFRLVAPAGGAYTPLWITVGEDSSLAPASPKEPELLPVTPLLRLGPWAEPLRERLHVELFPPSGASREGLGLYAYEGGGWRFLAADTSGRGVAARLTNLESLALLRDRTPPRVAVLPVPSGARPAIRARVTDGGAGVTASGLLLTVDGAPVIAEWDPEADLLRSHLREDLPAGEHRVIVVATDRAGNTSEAGIVFRTP